MRFSIMMHVAGSEFRYAVRSLPALLTFGALFSISFLFTANAVEFQTFVNGSVLWANSPSRIVDLLIKFSVFSIPAIPAFIATAILKDTDHRFDAILFAMPVSKSQYLNGRFVGAFFALTLAISGVPLGMMVGTFWPWATPELLGPVRLQDYLAPFFGIAMPSLLVVSAILFAIAAATRSMILSYIGALALMTLYLVVSLLDSPSPLLDPFLYNLFETRTQYWTAVELNTRTFEFDADVWTNRLIWLSIALAIYIIGYRIFSFRVATPARTRKDNRVDAAPLPASDHRGTPAERGEAVLLQLTHRLGLEIRDIARSVPFVLLLGLSGFVLFLSLSHREVMYGVNAHPETWLLIESMTVLTLPMVVVSAFYSAEIFWRERQCGIQEVIAATPTSNWVFVTAKVGGLAFILLSIVLLGILMALSMQLADGQSPLELGLYVRHGLLITWLPMVYIAILACFFQVLTRNRFGGMVLFGLFMLGIIASRDLLSWEHPLLSFGLPAVGAPLSGMNGADAFVGLAYWIRAYWGAIAGLLLILTYGLWTRGTLQPLIARLRADRLLASRGTRWSASGLLLLAIGSGGFIYYNTNVLHDYVPQAEVHALQADYERRYRPYAQLPMPRTVAVAMHVDLYPQSRRVVSRGSHVLENKTDRPIETVHIVFDSGAEVQRVDLESAAQIRRDSETFNYYIADLAAPMAPGERRTLRFEQITERSGFPHQRPDTTLVENGTFITNEQLAPHIGFQPAYLLDDPAARQANGLPPLPRRPLLEDESEYQNNVLRQDSDFVQFQITVSTAADQTAVAPGYLKDSWTDGERRYFAYEMDVPIRNFYSVLSARYASRTDRWRDVDLEVLHHPPHDANLDRMLMAAKDSLEYFSVAFSPYQYRQLRIIEFPGYRDYAQSFPTTIPYSESIGFLADVRPGDLDMPYYVTAHEVAHQWWGHQISAANVQGDGLIHETLAQYSALLVMEQRYGPHGIRPFLRYELDRYLSERSEEALQELPLIRVEDQPYIHYRKGTLVMFALRDYLGADRVNRVLKRLVERRAYSSNPYATSLDFLELLRAEAGPQHAELIADLFERITLFDLRVHDARVRKLADGRFALAIDVETAKLYAGKGGAETRATFDLPVDIGLFLAHPDDPTFGSKDVITLDKRRVPDGRSTIELTVDSPPKFVGIDPYHKLIDRDIDDNILRTNME